MIEAFVCFLMNSGINGINICFLKARFKCSQLILCSSKATEWRSSCAILHVLDNNAYNPIETKAVTKVIAKLTYQLTIEIGPKT